MKIMPVSLNLFSTGLNPVFGGKRDSKYTRNAESVQDTFTKREDKNTKAYKALIMRANEAERADKNAKITASDIRFLLDIKDYEKFRSIISTPVTIKKTLNEDKRNLFYYADANAARQLAKKLNENGDRALLKKLLMQTTGYKGETVFHKIAKDDDVKKAQALKDNLSVKEFRKFMCAKNAYEDTPYGMAQENNGKLKAFLDEVFQGELMPY